MIVSVNGPLTVRQKEEKIDRAVIEVLFKSASGQSSQLILVFFALFICLVQRTLMWTRAS